MDLCQPSVIKQLMEEAGIRFRKDFGQNFLINPDVIQCIIEHANISKNDIVLEYCYDCIAKNVNWCTKCGNAVNYSLKNEICETCRENNK